jgi:(1->4)-alpha-D-glucan 1-alpha-D-glucosylmutase
MAKGVEDTVFYCYNRFVALNEVGGMPARFGVALEAFHDWAGETQRDRPATLLATSTHDTKRSEDVRARLALLSEIPDSWGETVTRWARKNQAHRREGWPDRNIEYLLYQTLVGAWPIGRDRMLRYAEKAAREAKQHTSWTRPSASYETALAEFVSALFDDAAFLADLEAFVAPLIEPGRTNSLALTLVKLTSPGVPDLYQGTELWDLSLVDPDNRRPVDYQVRRSHLEVLDGMPLETVRGRADEGLPKLWLIRRALALRHAEAPAFGPEGTYRPLAVRGARAGHAIAFTRCGRIASIAPRLVLTLGGDWQDTAVDLPAGRWRDVLAGRELDGGWTRLGMLLEAFPVALLAKVGA